MSKHAKFFVLCLTAALPGCGDGDPPDGGNANAGGGNNAGGGPPVVVERVEHSNPGWTRVEPRDLDELKEQLDTLMDEIQIPEELDFDDLGPVAPFDPGFGNGGGIPRKPAKNGEWRRQPKPGEKKPPTVTHYMGSRDGTSFTRIDYTVPGATGGPAVPLPKCDEPFIVSGWLRWSTQQCTKQQYEEKFEELKLRLLAEAIVICQRTDDLCQTARPIQPWYVNPWCFPDQNVNQDVSAAINVQIEFVCVGN